MGIHFDTCDQSHVLMSLNLLYLVVIYNDAYIYVFCILYMYLCGKIFFLSNMQ